MPSRADHYREAERLLREVTTFEQRHGETGDRAIARRRDTLAAAQVHATLATTEPLVEAEVVLG